LSLWSWSSSTASYDARSSTDRHKRVLATEQLFNIANVSDAFAWRQGREWYGCQDPDSSGSARSAATRYKRRLNHFLPREL
jgi:hypothetical protein